MVLLIPCLPGVGKAVACLKGHIPSEYTYIHFKILYRCLPYSCNLGGRQRQRGKQADKRTDRQIHKKAEKSMK